VEKPHNFLRESLDALTSLEVIRVIQDFFIGPFSAVILARLTRAFTSGAHHCTGRCLVQRKLGRLVKWACDCLANTDPAADAGDVALAITPGVNHA
jgi:hypothetical protein